MFVEEQSVIPALAKVALRSPATWRRCSYRLGLLGVSAWLVVRGLVALWQFTIDDSGISYAYARHIATGLGPVAAPGAPWVEGYSNALWVMLLAPFQWFSLPLADVSKWLGVACFAVSLGVGVWLLLKEYGQRLGTAALAAGWALLLGTCVEVVVWVVAGLENALLGALLLGLVAADRAEREHPERLPLSSLIGFALCITRPEGILYAAPILALKGWGVWRSGRSWGPVLRAALYFAVPLILYHALHFAVFHEWVPNTYYAKPQGRSLGRGVDYLRKGLRDTGLGYLLPLAALGCVRAVRNKIALVWYCVAGTTFILYSGGDWMPYARFVSYFAPALVLLAVHGVANIGALTAWAVERLAPRFRDIIVEATVLMVLGGAVWLWRNHHEPRFAKESKSKFCHFCQRTSDSARLQKVSRDADLGRVTVLTHDFGGPSWQANESYYPLDFLGLCDASIARIRRDQDRMWANTLLSPYLFHEQPHAPTWIYLPRNFWKGLKDLPEYRSGYYALSSRLLPHAPGGSYVALHRGQLVDFFPPTNPTAKPVPVSPGLGLSGVGWFSTSEVPSRLESGASVRVVLSVVPRQPLRGSESLWVELSGVGKPVKSEKMPLARGIAGLGSQLAVGEPLRLETTLTVPPSKQSATPLQLKLSVGSAATKRGAKDELVAVATLDWASELPVYERVASRFPTGLPVVTLSELASHQRRVATAVERQHLGPEWHQTADDIELAKTLRHSGDELLASAPEQAYVAYVWATQLDARQWEDLTKPLLSLRKPIDDANLGHELALLRDYYVAQFAGARPTTSVNVGTTPSPGVPAEQGVSSVVVPTSIDADLAGRRLVAFYTKTGDLAKAEYFARYLQSAAETPAGLLWSWSQPFEDGKGFDWTGDRGVFSVEHPDVTARKKWRGLSGTGYLSSRIKGDKAKGSVTSPAFTLNGSRLSFSFGGGASKADVGVELLVDGAVVLSAPGGTQTVLASFWWDVTPWFGKTAQLRVFDKSTREAAFLDQVLLWN